jgi:hypothetical protein
VKVSTILDHVDSGHMALPEFQRGYVWNRDQVRALFSSLYRRYPVGSLLVWATESRTADHRGDGQLAPGVVKLLLDGQQRITSLYGVVRGKPPKFFDGNATTFTGLRFHLNMETFAFFQPQKMQGDPLWIDVTELMKRGAAGLGEFAAQINKQTSLAPQLGKYVGRLATLLGIVEIDLHVEEVTGEDKTLGVVVEIFNQANTGGTKLSKGDLALAKICVDWPDARDEMKGAIAKWKKKEYNFSLDWLLRSMNTVLTGEAKFSFLEDKSPPEIRLGLKTAVNRIDTCLNQIGNRLGLDHDQVLFSRYAIPVMVRYIDRHQGPLNAAERDKLLFWFVQAGMWGRFSGSTETFIDQDLATLEGVDGGLDKLLEQLRLWHGVLRAEPANFAGWSLGARFYPLLYLITRMGEAKDWGTGQTLKTGLLGNMSRLEMHHIFPKAQLYKLKHNRPEVNALANFCFQTKETNLEIGDRLPEEYFPRFEARHPGVLATQWIPTDHELWNIGKFESFLEARRQLLAAETNKRLSDLLHGDLRWMEGSSKPTRPSPALVQGGIADETEEAQLVALNDWVEERGLPRGELAYDVADAMTGEQQAILDLAWPIGVQEGLSQPVAVLLNESSGTLAVASRAGFRCFTEQRDFKEYLEKEILANDYS